MILDSGICTVLRRNGRVFVPVYQSWFKELSFETQPSKENESEGVQTNARVRVCQSRSLEKGDAVVLRNANALSDFEPYYEITRAFHGQDDDNGQPITDLTLTASLMTEPIMLVPGVAGTDSMGAKTIRPGAANRRTVAAEVRSLGVSEQYLGMAYDQRPELKAFIYADDFGDEPFVLLDGQIYSIQKRTKYGLKYELVCEEVEAWDTASST